MEMTLTLFLISQARGPGNPAAHPVKLQLVGMGLGHPSFNQLLYRQLLHFLVNGQVKKKNPKKPFLILPAGNSFTVQQRKFFF